MSRKNTRQLKALAAAAVALLTLMSLGSAAWAYNMSLPDQTLVQGWIDHNTAAAYGYYGYDPVDTIPPNDVHWDLKRVDLTWTPSNTDRKSVV